MLEIAYQRKNSRSLIGQMSSFTVQALEEKLSRLSPSQDSIETLSLWIIHHKAHASVSVAAWTDDLTKADADRRLVLLYLANDILQNGRRRGTTDFLELFRNPLRQAATMARGEKIQTSVERMFRIWKDRKVYDNTFVKELERLIEPEKVEGHKVAPLQPFKLSLLGDANTELRKFEGEMKVKSSHLANLRMDVSNMSTLTRLKDKSEGGRFSGEFEEASHKLQDYCECLGIEVNERINMVDMLTECKAYMSRQLAELQETAKNYRDLRLLVDGVKEKLQQRVKELARAQQTSTSDPSAKEDITDVGDMEIDSDTEAQEPDVVKPSVPPPTSQPPPIALRANSAPLPPVQRAVLPPRGFSSSQQAYQPRPLFRQQAPPGSYPPPPATMLYQSRPALPPRPRAPVYLNQAPRPFMRTPMAFHPPQPLSALRPMNTSSGPPVLYTQPLPPTAGNTPPTRTAPIQPNVARPLPPTSIAATQPNMARPLPPTSIAATQPNMARPLPPTSIAATQPNMARPLLPTSIAATQPNMARPLPPTSTAPIHINMARPQFSPPQTVPPLLPPAEEISPTSGLPSLDERLKDMVTHKAFPKVLLTDYSDSDTDSEGRGGGGAQRGKLPHHFAVDIEERPYSPSGDNLVISDPCTPLDRDDESIPTPTTEVPTPEGASPSSPGPLQLNMDNPIMQVLYRSQETPGKEHEPRSSPSPSRPLISPTLPKPSSVVPALDTGLLQSILSTVGTNPPLGRVLPSPSAPPQVRTVGPLGRVLPSPPQVKVPPSNQPPSPRTDSFISTEVIPTVPLGGGAPSMWTQTSAAIDPLEKGQSAPNMKDIKITASLTTLLDEIFPQLSKTLQQRKRTLDSAPLPEPKTQRVGPYPPGAIIRPSGAIIRPPGTIVRPPGTIVRPPGAIIRPPGTTTIIRPPGRTATDHSHGGGGNTNIRTPFIPTLESPRVFWSVPRPLAPPSPRVSPMPVGALGPRIPPPGGGRPSAPSPTFRPSNAGQPPPGRMAPMQPNFQPRGPRPLMEIVPRPFPIRANHVDNNRLPPSQRHDHFPPKSFHPRLPPSLNYPMPPHSSYAPHPQPPLSTNSSSMPALPIATPPLNRPRFM